MTTEEFEQQKSRGLKFKKLYDKKQKAINFKESLDNEKVNYFENSHHGYVFQSKKAIEMFQRTLKLCLDIEIEEIQKELEEI